MRPLLRPTAGARLAALRAAHAVIEFDLGGRILDANERFLALMGYTLGEIRGRHHSMFLEPGAAGSEAYRAFWQALAAGRHQSAEFRRFAKGGREVWIQASYCPVLDRAGRPRRVLKLATDITERKLAAAEQAGQLEAIGRSQAMILFELDGTIVTANENFLRLTGYRLEEVRGRHHRMFVAPEDQHSPPMRPSGRRWAGANTRRPSIAAWARAGARSGSRPATTRCSIPPAGPGGW